MQKKQPFLLRGRFGNRAGNSLIIVLGIIALGALLTASSIRITSARYRNSHCSTSWNRAIFAAESGVDLAIVTIRQNNWTANGWSRVPGAPGEPPATRQFAIQNDVILCGAALNVDTVSLGGKNWYRIRSQGWSDLPDKPEAAPDKQDNTLRKLSLRTDRITGTAVTKPNVSRIVEVLVEPMGARPFVKALLARQTYDIPSNTTVDSFDSTDTTKSTGGLYDVAKRQHNGDVGTLGGASWTLHNAYIYGDVSSPYGVMEGAANVQGEVKDLFAFTFPSMSAPAWALIHQNFGALSNTAVTAEAGTASAPKRYKFDSVDLTSASGHIHLTLPPGETEGHVDVWIPNNVMVHSGGRITVDPGVHATFHIGGDATIKGTGIVNGSQRANHVTILGYGGNSGTHPNIVIEATDFIGGVCAPWYNVTLDTPGRDISGSFASYSLDVRDNVRVHYDEHLGTRAIAESGELRIRSWAEAVR